MIRKMARTARNRELLKALRLLAPRAPLHDFEAIETIATRGHLRHLPPSVIAWQALTTHVRHAHTDYDALLADGYDVDSARHFATPAINEKLLEWGCPRQLDLEEEFGT